jgi:zinc protease
MILRVFVTLTLLVACTSVRAEGDPALADQAARAAWGFDRSNLAPHPNVRFGVLANGMRYALMRNAHPAAALSVRMRIDIGAAAEGEREQGYVHLLEHLIFHGSKNHPQGSLLFTLPRDGLRRQSDFGAETNYDETRFRLDLARSDARARETALSLMREIAQHLSFSRQTVNLAKQAVRDEIAARDAIQDQLMTAQNRLLLPGSPLARGPVAGSVRSVSRASPADLRRLYDLYYTPRRAILVMVGDFDPAAVEDEIVAHLSAWQPRAAGSVEAPRALLTERAQSRAGLFVHPGAPTSVTIARVWPLGNGPDTVSSREAHYLEQLGSELLDRRLRRLSMQPGAPFVDVLAAAYNYFSAARVASLDLTSAGRDWRSTLRAGQLALGEAAEHGFTQTEFDEHLTVLRSGLRPISTSQASTALADAIVDAAGRGIIYTGPGDPAATEAWLAGIKLDDVNAAFRAIWQHPERLTFVSHNEAISEDLVVRELAAISSLDEPMVSPIAQVSRITQSAAGDCAPATCRIAASAQSK